MYHNIYAEKEGVGQTVPGEVVVVMVLRTTPRPALLHIRSWQPATSRSETGAVMMMMMMIIIIKSLNIALSSSHKSDCFIQHSWRWISVNISITNIDD